MALDGSNLTTDEVPGDLTVVTCFFHAGAEDRRVHNYHLFREAIQQVRVPLVTIELAFADHPFCLDGPEVRQLRGGDIMWQKERLLNIAVADLPAQLTKIVWLDADSVITTADWPNAISLLLDEFAAVQVCSRVVWAQGPQATLIDPVPTRSAPAAAANPDAHEPRGLIAPGGGWGIQRDLWQRFALYDRMIVGGGDAAFFLATTCDPQNPQDWAGRVRKRASFKKMSEAHWRDYLAWVLDIAPGLYGQIGFLKGDLWSLWHGTVRSRRYVKRHRILSDFDPRTDLIQDEQTKVWQWTTSKTQMRAEVASYMNHRSIE